ncbi:MAG TPA: glycerol-3-phosphate acyltransferase [Anaerolineae bacterium]|nr:glycerol-3-phosphate acyltransferase [Anaerolineae bacterium]HQI86836.1 glycerol-3-phosphate acyltransferase [Anaerolineae bacterium]
MFELLLAGIWGYLVGAIPTGVIVAWAMRGVDVRTTGSGHTGGLNVTRVAGLWGGALTALGDILLGALAVVVARTVWSHPLAGTVAGIAVVVGHDWSVYIRFAGGIGLAKLTGCLLAISASEWWLALIAVVIALALWLGLIRFVRVHRARSTILVMALAGPLLWVLGFPLPVILLGTLGGIVVMIKTIPDWNRVYG